MSHLAPALPAAPPSPPAPPLAPAAPAAVASPSDDERLREALKRCPAATYEAARQFRATGDSAHLSTIVLGVIERYVERDLRSRLHTGAREDLRLVEDLAIDSLTMMEIVLLTEDVLRITINNEELQGLRTVGDVERFLAAKLGRATD